MSRFVTPATTPGAPAIVSSSLTSGSITFNWTAPTSDGGDSITDYEYRYASTSGGLSSAIWASSGTSSPATITGLAAGIYYIHIRAVNGVGGWSYIECGRSTDRPLSFIAKRVW